MLAFTVYDTKKIMAYLLKGDIFDHFAFRQAEIYSFASFSINGTKDETLLTEEDKEPYCLWSEIKPIVFETVKGKRLPKSMKLVFSLTKEKTNRYPNAKAVFLNLLFREGTLLCTTSVAEETFSLEQKANKQWDEDILAFFKKHEVTIQIET
ncbi:hypothetical protein CLNEO_19850 [Anaerotignum neopropionicum]|uniref:Uncharacterized protein n=1 Tax=Anaerotignum neopropionicum TaxID=36847 RepID=A0A136WDK9_9FIRM|nr:DUF5721 family protein [Anaerotignum neopropionicum]KXL52576.1 hypothetical protein CLNEO_19850 [Anaerotignum neopropionicum]